ncbi:hypothetical protein [Niastella sp. OAS944]|uniref:hypothetical protein n=1 Tax=Niastella sp. OAS944 TaxID=2664089 RepID=UPI0034739E62|nr:putative membrane protein [Chitinophagaceae bacterium OAS944]
MTPHSVYLIFLILHLTAFALFTGTLIANLINNNQLWQYSEKDLTITKALFQTTDRYNKIMAASLGIALVMGILMMTQMHKVYGAQTWMRVKIALVLVIVVIRVLYSRNVNKFKKRLAGETSISMSDVKKKVSLYQLVQIILVAGIIVLSVCRFN